MEGFGGFEVFRGVTGEEVSLIGAQVKLHDFTGLVGEIYLFEVYPEGVGG